MNLDAELVTEYAKLDKWGCIEMSQISTCKYHW